MGVWPYLDEPESTRLKTHLWPDARCIHQERTANMGSKINSIFPDQELIKKNCTLLFDIRVVLSVIRILPGFVTWHTPQIGTKRKKKYHLIIILYRPPSWISIYQIKKLK